MLTDDFGTEVCQSGTNPDDSCRLPVLGRAGPAWLGGWMDSGLGGRLGAGLARQRAVKKQQGQLFGRTHSAP